MGWRRGSTGSRLGTRVDGRKNPISPPHYLRAGFLWDRLLARISHRLTVEARDRPAITSLRLLAVLNVLSEYASARQAARASY